MLRLTGCQDGSQVHSGEAGLTFPPSNTATCCFRLQFGAHRLRGLEQALKRPHAPLQGVHPLLQPHVAVRHEGAQRRDGGRVVPEDVQGAWPRVPIVRVLLVG